MLACSSVFASFPWWLDLIYYSYGRYDTWLADTLMMQGVVSLKFVPLFLYEIGSLYTSFYQITQSFLSAGPGLGFLGLFFYVFTSSIPSFIPFSDSLLWLDADILLCPPRGTWATGLDSITRSQFLLIACSIGAVLLVLSSGHLHSFVVSQLFSLCYLRSLVYTAHIGSTGTRSCLISDKHISQPSGNKNAHYWRASFGFALLTSMLFLPRVLVTTPSTTTSYCKYRHHGVRLSTLPMYTLPFSLGLAVVTAEVGSGCKALQDTGDQRKLFC